MRKTLLCLATAACLATACKPPRAPQAPEGVTVIDVASAMDELQPLKLSQLGKTVRYLPLQTTDSCLVGDHPGATIIGPYVIVRSQAMFLSFLHCFDKETGRFICSIGHRGDDPEGYWSPRFYHNPGNGLLYFKRLPGQLQRYDPQGRYRGKAQVPAGADIMDAGFAFADSLVYGYLADSSNRLFLSTFTEDGTMRDSLPLPALCKEKRRDEDVLIAGKRSLGNAIGTVSYSLCKDGSLLCEMDPMIPLWQCGDGIRLQMGFNDTLYTWRGHEVRPSIVFHFGPWTLDAEAYRQSKSRDKLALAGVYETDDKLYFQCVNNLFEFLIDEGQKFHQEIQNAASGVIRKSDIKHPDILQGIYDKHTGQTLMGEGTALEDDINGFLPFTLQTVTADEYVSTIPAEKVVEWMEAHPDEAQKNSALTPLRGVKAEDNPVVVIVGR